MTILVGSTWTGTPRDPAAVTPFSQPHGAKVGAKQRTDTEVITFASQVAGSVFLIGVLPRGSIFKGISLNLDTSTGSTTLSFGTSASAASLAALAALTSADTPTSRGKASAFAAAPVADDTPIYMTTAAATLPASGTLVTGLHYTVPA